MDENMRSTIASVKAVIETTRAQLEEMEQEPAPDRHLMAAVQDNYERAKGTLRILEKINGVEATVAVQPAQKNDTAVAQDESEEDQTINVTRHVDHSFQVIPPKATDELTVNEQALATPAESQAPQVTMPTEETPESSAAEVHMTRAEYREMMKKKGK